MAETYAYVLYDDETITELICAACVTATDSKKVGVTIASAIRCERCGKVAG